jgi:predicted transcriptional regulator of viral defense system
LPYLCACVSRATTQIPHEVYLALPGGAEAPRLEHPPIRIFWFTQKAFVFGAQVHRLDGTPVKIYNPEKTVANCFKYRNKIGLDTARQALKFYLERRKRIWRACFKRLRYAASPG